MGDEHQHHPPQSVFTAMGRLESMYDYDVYHTHDSEIWANELVNSRVNLPVQTKQTKPLCGFQSKHHFFEPTGKAWKGGVNPEKTCISSGSVDQRWLRRTKILRGLPFMGHPESSASQRRHYMIHSFPLKRSLGIAVPSCVLEMMFENMAFTHLINRNSKPP